MILKIDVTEPAPLASDWKWTLPRVTKLRRGTSHSFAIRERPVDVTGRFFSVHNGKHGQGRDIGQDVNLTRGGDTCCVRRRCRS